MSEWTGLWTRCCALLGSQDQRRATGNVSEAHLLVGDVKYSSQRDCLHLSALYLRLRDCTNDVDRHWNGRSYKATLGSMHMPRSMRAQ